MLPAAHGDMAFQMPFGKKKRLFCSGAKEAGVAEIIIIVRINDFFQRTLTRRDVIYLPTSEAGATRIGVSFAGGGAAMEAVT